MSWLRMLVRWLWWAEPWFKTCSGCLTPAGCRKARTCVVGLGGETPTPADKPPV